MTRQGSPRPCPCLHLPTAPPPPRSTSSANRSRSNSYSTSRNEKSQNNARDSCRRFSHTRPRLSKTSDSLGGIKPNSDSLCYLRFTEKARPPVESSQPTKEILLGARQASGRQLFDFCV